MSKPNRLFLNTFVVLCLIPALGGQSQEPGDRDRSIRRAVNLVLVDVIVNDPFGNAPKGLRAQDFEVLDEMASQEIVHFSQDEIPSAIALLVDVSDSMKELMEPVRNGLRQALPSLKPEDRVALFSFNHAPRFHVELTRDIDRLSSSIQGFRTGGGTNFNDPIYDATKYLRKVAPQSRLVTILVTDLEVGWRGSTSADRVKAELLESEGALFAIVPSIPASVGESRPDSNEHVFGAVSVYGLAGSSGGFCDGCARAGWRSVCDGFFVPNLKNALHPGFLSECFREAWQGSADSGSFAE